MSSKQIPESFDEPHKNAFLLAIGVLGGQAEAVRQLRMLPATKDLTFSRLHHHLGNGICPADLCPWIEVLTRLKGEPVTCKELRPDVYPAWLFLPQTRTKMVRIADKLVYGVG